MHINATQVAKQQANLKRSVKNIDWFIDRTRAPCVLTTLKDSVKEKAAKALSNDGSFGPRPTFGRSQNPPI